MRGRVTATISKFSPQIFETYFRMIKIPPKSAIEFTQLLQLNDLDVKVRSHDSNLRIRFLVSKIAGRCSDGLISRFRFCGENVRRSFVVCSHDPIFRTDNESSIWPQSDHRDIIQNLSAPFIFQEEPVSDENRVCSISIRFFKLTDLCVGMSFSMCSHDPIFGTNKNQILKNG